jgi:hypothetical protein
VSERGWTNHPPVRERCPRRTRSLWGTLAGFVVAVLPWGAWLAQQNECLRLVYAVDTLRSQQETLEELERRVRVELAAAHRLGEIEDWAAAQQGLVRPEPARVVIVPRAAPSAPDLVARSQQPGATARAATDDVR